MIATVDAGTGAVVAEAVIIVGGGLFGVWKYAINQGRRDAKIDRVLRQVEPNGGTSLRDDVTQMRREMKTLTTAVERLDRRVDTIQAAPR